MLSDDIREPILKSVNDHSLLAKNPGRVNPYVILQIHEIVSD